MVFVLLCGCSTGSGPQPAVAPAPAPADAARTFVGAAWHGLRWGMTMDEVTAALDAAHLAYKREPGATGGFADRPGGEIREISFDQLSFVEDGWNGTVELRGGVLASISMGRELAEAEVERTIAALEGRYGAPERFAAPANPRARWRNDTTLLELTVTPGGAGRVSVWQTWRPLASP